MKPNGISPGISRLLLLLIICSLSSCSEEGGNLKSDTDIEKMKLKGDVISLCETVFHARDSSGMKNGIPLYHSDYRFNKDGNIVEQKYYVSDSTKCSTTICKYDKHGILTDKIVMNDELSEIRKETWKYDSQGRLIEKSDFNNLAGIVYTETYYYNRENSEVERVLCKSRFNGNIASVYNSDGVVRGEKSKQVIKCQLIKMLYKLDENGNRIEEIYFRSDDTPGARIVNRYDEKGRKTEERHIRSDGGSGPWYKSNFDEFGNLIEILSYNQFDSLFYRVKMRYDSIGRLTERWSGSPKNDLTPDIKIKYNESGDVLEEIRDFGSRFSQVSYKYQYDETGNWISRIKEEISPETGRSFLVSTTERVLKYY